MKLLKLKVATSELQQFADQVSKALSIDYSNQSTDMVAIASEIYKFRTNSAQLNIVILKRVESQIHIDIIGALVRQGYLELVGVLNLDLSKACIVRSRIFVN